MISPEMGVLGTVGAYLLVILGIGEYARRQTRPDTEDYFMASRSFGTIVLLFALLATNMTA
ncbi:MAG: SSS family solute:Na+ symporter, partial [Halobacteriales archaeon]